MVLLHSFHLNAHNLLVHHAQTTDEKNNFVQNNKQCHI